MVNPDLFLRRLKVFEVELRVKHRGGAETLSRQVSVIIDSLMYY